MTKFIIAKKITISHDQDLDDVKGTLKQYLSQFMTIHAISAGHDKFSIEASTSSWIDLIHSAKISATVDMSVEDTKTSRELCLSICGSASLSLSMALIYLILFCAILLAGLLPGSIETGSEKSSALDALVFLLIGYYLKSENDRSLEEVKSHFSDSIHALAVRFGQ